VASSVLDFSDGLQQPSAFGLPQSSQVQTIPPVGSTQIGTVLGTQAAPSQTAVATGTPSAPTVASGSVTTPPAPPTGPTCGIGLTSATSLSACFSGDNFIAGALGFILIIAGLFLFKPVREAIVTTGKKAAVAV